MTTPTLYYHKFHVTRAIILNKKKHWVMAKSSFWLLVCASLRVLRLLFMIINYARQTENAIKKNRPLSVFPWHCDLSHLDIKIHFEFILLIEIAHSNTNLLFFKDFILYLEQKNNLLRRTTEATRRHLVLRAIIMTFKIKLTTFKQVLSSFVSWICYISMTNKLPRRRHYENGRHWKAYFGNP